jgi:serine/threonine-protein phosphatase 2A regulatory subunit B
VQLCDLYENDSIFDKFECCLSGDGSRVSTGSYRSGSTSPISDFVIFEPASYYFVSFDASNLFRVFGCAPGSTEATTLEASKNPMR